MKKQTKQQQLINLQVQLSLYFQKQAKFSSQCGVHSLNNLMGCEMFSQKMLNDICYNLSNSFINPHKHILGGDYDANIMMIALQTAGLNTKWLDNRKQIQLKFSQKQNLFKFGYLINSQLKKSFYHNFLKLSGRHWFVIKFIDNQYFLLDSLKESPTMIQEIQSLLNDLRKNGAQIIEVSKKQK